MHIIPTPCPRHENETTAINFQPQGPSPHNSNLAAKGIVALEAWAQVLNLIDGQAKLSALYSSKASEFYADWLELAIDSSGDHYKIQYNLDDTFSLKVSRQVKVDI